ncbi:hypothetical protein [Acinetobacter haemolyticus]|uniref:hypothetical protein n=1 Tax=Acinetobacter haemolyticus TaxID=29430 RepID=UPI003AF57606
MKRLIILFALVLVGCSSNKDITMAYQTLSELPEEERHPVYIYAEDIKKKYPELRYAVREDRKLIRYNPIDAHPDYEFTPDKQHWLDIGLYRASEGNDWWAVAVFSRYLNNYESSKKEALKYCKEILEIANPNFSIVFDDIISKFEKKVQETGYRMDFTTIGENYSVDLDGSTFDKGDPFLCTVYQN